MFKRISIRITTIFIAVTVLVVLITSIIFSFLFCNYTLTERKNTLQSCAEEIARLVSEDKASSYNYNERIITDYNLFSKSVLNANVWVVNTNGVFDRTYEFDEKMPLNIMELDSDEIELIREAFDGVEFDTNKFSDYFGEDTLSVLVPIYETKIQEMQKVSVLGTVIVHCPLVSINESFESAVGFLVISVIVAVVVTIIMSTMLSRTITYPVLQMSSVATLMATGNYNVQVDIKDRSEIGELADVLNHLARTLNITTTELQTEKDKLNDIINNVSDGLASFDNHLNLIKCNSAFMRLCEYEALEQSYIKDWLLRALSTRQILEYTHEDKDILKFMITPLYNGNEVVGVILVVRDVSQSERLELTRREFVSDVSHEFKTPLTVIKGSVEMLMDGTVTEPEMVEKTYKRIEGETEALERLVGDLLDISRLKAGTVRFNSIKVDINSLGAEVVDNLQIIAQKKKINLTFCPNGVLPVRGDMDRLRQLFIIFIDNAIKFTPEGGHVMVSTIMVDEMACIKVRDTGKGIRKDDIPYIFERFYKVDKSRGNSMAGTGLGLSIANSIVELHGGGILVNSEVGRGTEFSIMLPLFKEKKK